MNGLKLSGIGEILSKNALQQGAQTMQSGANGRTKDPDVGKTVKIIRGGYVSRHAAYVLVLSFLFMSED